jgi:hypothetical protein
MSFGRVVAAVAVNCLASHRQLVPLLLPNVPASANNIHISDTLLER